MSEKGANKGKSRSEVAPNHNWHRLPEEQLPGTLMANIQHIHKNQNAADAEAMMISQLYGGRLPGSAFGTPQQYAAKGVNPSLAGRLTYNLLAIVFDTLTSKITKDNVATQFLTQGGNYREQRRSKKLSQFADGINYETKMDELGPDIFRDALMSPCAYVHTFADWVTKRVRCERVMHSELLVDYADGFYGFPTQMHRIKMMDREQLLATEWAEDKKIAEAIKTNHDTGPLGWGGEFQGLSDMIAVGESWRLPSGVEEDGVTPTEDGRHVIYISNAILNKPDQRIWRKRRFPFSVFRWKKGTEGWHGIPLGRDLIGAQVECNHLLVMFQRAFRMMAAFRIAVQTGTVPDQHFQDKIGTILHVPTGGMVPQFLTPPALNDQYFRHLEDIKRRAFETARLSQLSAVGEKPAGLDSGEAQRVYHDIESEGFSCTQKNYEEFRLDVTRMQIDVVRDIFSLDKKEGYKLKAPMSSSTMPGHRFLKTIDWKDVQLEEDQYVLRPYSISGLPNTPSGRLSTINDMMRQGIIDVDLGRKLLNLPDLQQAMSLLGAMEDWIMTSLDAIIEDGKPKSPHPYMPIAMARKLGLQEYALGAANGMEPEKLALLEKWLADCDRLETKAKKAAVDEQMQAAMTAQAAQAPPAPVDVSGPGPQALPMQQSQPQLPQMNAATQ